MEITYINTEDGKTKVEWWEKEKFTGRSSRMYTADSTEDFLKGTNLELVSVIPVPDDVILCDFCNEQITEFPVPVVWGTHAVCTGCLKRMTKKGDGNNGHHL